LQQAQQELKSLNEEKMKLEQQKIQLEYRVQWFNANTDKEYKENQIEV
jgi:hypothetical protein